MQVIYFLFALEKFQCLFELISVSFYLCNLCLCEFLYRICLNENDVNIFETIETRHFNTSLKLHQISSRRNPPSKSNKWAITISVYFFNIWHKYSREKKNKTCVTKILFTNFTRRNCFLQVWKNLFIVLKIRSHEKVTCIFVNCYENKKIFACCFPLLLFSRSVLSVVQS